MVVRRRTRAQALKPIIKRNLEVVPEPLPSPIPAKDVDLDAVYKELVMWKSRESRETLEAFAASQGVSVETLRELAQRPSFGDDCLREAMSWGKTQVPTMLRIMQKAALETESSTEAQRFVEAVASLSKDREKIVSNQTQVNIFANVDDEKFARIAQRFIKDIPESSS